VAGTDPIRHGGTDGNGKGLTSDGDVPIRDAAAPHLGWLLMYGRYECSNQRTIKDEAGFSVYSGQCINETERVYAYYEYDGSDGVKPLCDPCALELMAEGERLVPAN